MAKRKLRETWRDAVARRAGPEDDGCLRAFDRLVAEGRGDAEAAFRVLEARGLLWRVDEPGTAAPTRAEPGEVPGV